MNKPKLMMKQGNEMRNPKGWHKKLKGEEEEKRRASQEVAEKAEEDARNEEEERKRKLDEELQKQEVDRLKLTQTET